MKNSSDRQHQLPILGLGPALVALTALLTGSANAQQTANLEIQSGDHVLAATLTLPAGPGPFPGVVLISGSGPQDRDEALPGVALKPFARLADELAGFGVATLRYDDRGTAASTGDFLSATPRDLADDAEAVFDALHRNPAILPSGTGLLGHSEGGAIAAMVAVRNPEVSYVVSLAGNAVSGYDLFADQLKESLSALPPDQQRAILAEKMAELDLVVAGDWDEIEAILSGQSNGSDSYVRDGLVYYRGWLHGFVTYDPAVDWARLTQPVLAIYGDVDKQVRPALHLPALTANLSGNEHAEILLLPQANHLFQTSLTGDPTEYGSLPDAFVPGFSERVSTWIHSQHTGDSK